MTPPFEVTFRYDESIMKWEVVVKGATSELEALQGFCAVVLTVGDAVPAIDLNIAEKQADGTYKIKVGIQSNIMPIASRN